MMRILILLLLVMTACSEDKTEEEDNYSYLRLPVNDEGEVDTSKMASISFDKTVIDLDTVYSTDTIYNIFPFTNTGSQPLYFNSVKTNCGCTSSYYPDYLIDPGQRDSIVIQYAPFNKSGETFNTIRVYANTYPSLHELKIKSFVKQ